MIIAAQNMDETHLFLRTACETKNVITVVVEHFPTQGHAPLERSRAFITQTSPSAIPLWASDGGLSQSGMRGL